MNDATVDPVATARRTLVRATASDRTRDRRAAALLRAAARALRHAVPRGQRSGWIANVAWPWTRVTAFPSAGTSVRLELRHRGRLLDVVVHARRGAVQAIVHEPIAPVLLAAALLLEGGAGPPPDGEEDLRAAAAILSGLGETLLPEARRSGIEPDVETVSATPFDGAHAAIEDLFGTQCTTVDPDGLLQRLPPMAQAWTKPAGDLRPVTAVVTPCVVTVEAPTDAMAVLRLHARVAGIMARPPVTDDAAPRPAARDGWRTWFRWGRGPTGDME